MTWIRLDVGFFRNRKMRAIGKHGRPLYIAGLLYAGEHLTDGEVPKDVIAILAAEAEVPPSTVNLLVAKEAWVDQGDHFFIPDYLEFQRSRADVESERTAAKVRQRARRSSREQDPNLLRSSDATEHDSTETPSRDARAAQVEAEFEEWWLAYPRKVAKKRALKCWVARRKEGVGLEQLVRAGTNYATACAPRIAKGEVEFVMHGSTFLGPDERWRDYLEAPSSNGSRPAARPVSSTCPVCGRLEGIDCHGHEETT